MNVNTDWKFIKVIASGEPFFINGIGIWEHNWKDTDQTILILDPIYQRPYTMPIYEVVEGRMIMFATTEFSNGMWGIYVPVLSNYVIGYIH